MRGLQVRRRDVAGRAVRGFVLAGLVGAAVLVGADRAHGQGCNGNGGGYYQYPTNGNGGAAYGVNGNGNGYAQEVRYNGGGYAPQTYGGNGGGYYQPRFAPEQRRPLFVILNFGGRLELREVRSPQQFSLPPGFPPPGSYGRPPIIIEERRPFFPGSAPFSVPYGGGASGFNGGGFAPPGYFGGNGYARPG